MAKEICPCKECEPPQRFPGCHGSCQEYKAWQQTRAARAKQIIKWKAEEAIANDYTMSVISKHKNRKNVDKIKRM